MDLISTFKTVKRARNILRTLGAKSAAGFCKNRGMSLEEALVSLGMRVRRFV